MRDISTLKHKQEEIHLTLQSYIHNFYECLSVWSPSPGSYESRVTETSDIIVLDHEWYQTRRIGRREKLALHKIEVSN